jgi:hypothetical protein
MKKTYQNSSPEDLKKMLTKDILKSRIWQYGWWLLFCIIPPIAGFIFLPSMFFFTKIALIICFLILYGKLAFNEQGRIETMKKIRETIK